MLATLLVTGTAVASQDGPGDPAETDTGPGDQIVAALAQQDRDLAAGVTLDLRLRLAAGPSAAHHGDELQLGRMTRVGEEIGLATESQYSQPPRYVAPKSEQEHTNYDDQGRYLVWRRMREDALLTSETFTRRTEILLHRIDVNGKVEVAEQPFVSSLVFDAKDVWAHWQLSVVLNALGRGFAADLASSTFTSQKAGLATLRAPGHFVGRAGEWTAEVRTDLGHLVQSAAFSIPGASQPVLRIDIQTDPRSVQTGLGVAGTVHLGKASENQYVLELFLDAKAPRVDHRVLSGIRQRLTAPRGASAKTYDYRFGAVGGGFGPIDQDPFPELGPKPPCCLCQEVDPKIIECYNWPGASCHSFACQEKIVDSAQCTPFKDSVAQDCARSRTGGPLYTVLEKAVLDEDGPCPYESAPSNDVSERVVFPSSCYQCRKDQHDFYDILCERRSCSGPLIYTRHSGQGWDCPG